MLLVIGKFHSCLVLLPDQLNGYFIGESKSQFTESPVPEETKHYGIDYPVNCGTPRSKVMTRGRQCCIHTSSRFFTIRDLFYQ